jgi:hypothetical protein
MKRGYEMGIEAGIHTRAPRLRFDGWMFPPCCFSLAMCYLGGKRKLLTILTSGLRRTSPAQTVFCPQSIWFQRCKRAYDGAWIGRRGHTDELQKEPLITLSASNDVVNCNERSNPGLTRTR